MNAQQVMDALVQRADVQQVVVSKVQFEGKDLWTVAVPELELSACHLSLAVAYGEVQRQLTTHTVKRCSYWRAFKRMISARTSFMPSPQRPSSMCCASHADSTNNPPGKEAKHVLETLEPTRP